MAAMVTSVQVAMALHSLLCAVVIIDAIVVRL